MKAADIYADTLDHVMDTADEDLDGRDDADPDPMIDEWGYPTMSPSFDEDEMLEATYEPDEDDSQAKLPLLESYDLMEYTAPVSRNESNILDATPFLTDERGMPKDHLRLIDDPDHTQWLVNRSLQRHRAMDSNLDDQMYGGPMRNEEEAMDRADSDNLGFSIRKSLRKAGGFVKKGAGTALKYSPAGAAYKYGKAGFKKLGSVLTWPQRKMIGKFRNRLVSRRAKAIAMQNRRSTVPNEAEKLQARGWANTYLRTKGGKFGKVLAILSFGKGGSTKAAVKGTFIPSSSGKDQFVASSSGKVVRGEFVPSSSGDQYVASSSGEGVEGEFIPSSSGKDKFVASSSGKVVRGEFVPSSSGDQYVASSSGDDLVGIEPVTAALLGLSIPSLAILLSGILKRASKAGAPADPSMQMQEQDPSMMDPGGVEQMPAEQYEAAEPEDVAPSDEDEASGDKIADSILGRWMSGQQSVAAVVERARKGDPSAKDAIKKIIEKAKGGDEGAKAKYDNVLSYARVLRERKARERDKLYREDPDASALQGEAGEIHRNQI